MSKRAKRIGLKREPPRDYEPRAKLSELDVARIMIATECARQTVRNWMAGKPVKGATNGRISRAAAKLGLEVRA